MKTKTVKELRAEAKALAIPRYSKMRKAELLEAIAAHVEYDPAANSAKSYSLAINVMRAKLASFRREQIGECTLYLGDCCELLPLLPKVDCVVTDPPYGVNLGNHLAAKDRRVNRVLVKDGYSSYDDTPENFAAIVAPAIRAALANADRGLVFIAGRSAWMLPPPDAIGGVYLPSGCGRNAWGFASLAHCLLYGKAPSLEKGAKPTAKWSTDTAEKIDHPCPKPLSWMLWAVNLSSQPGHTILDPFAGSGTTGVACVKLGRRFIGIEIDERYFDIACRRIEEAYRQPDFFVQPSTRKSEQLALQVA